GLAIDQELWIELLRQRVTGGEQPTVAKVRRAEIGTEGGVARLIGEFGGIECRERALGPQRLTPNHHAAETVLAQAHGIDGNDRAYGVRPVVLGGGVTDGD